MEPEERPEIPASTPGGAPKGGEADEVVVPELVVILEALLDVRDIVLSDGEEVSHWATLPAPAGEVDPPRDG